MCIRFRMVKGLVFFVSLGFVLEARADKILFDFERVFDVRSVHASNAQVALTKGATGQAMSVALSGEGREAYVRLESPGWDLSAYRCIAMDISNHGQVGIGVLGSISVGGDKTSAESFVWVEPGQTETMEVVFFRRQPPEYMERFLTGMRGYPGGYMSHWLTPDLSKLNRVTISKARPRQEMHFSVDNIRAKGEYRLPTEEQLRSRFFPFVDQFGQYRHAEWPGKTTSQDDIDSQHQAERMDLASNRGPENWNQYGGWTSGLQLKATGHFRTQKLNEKWWLVDPSGRLFWSQGVTGVRLSQTTSTRRRKHYFVDMVDRGDFRQANLKRKFGDNWNTEAAQLTHTRFRSWGLNTFANWSDPELYGMSQTPYVVALGSGVAKDVPTELEEKAFEKLVRKRITAPRVAAFKEDPWCLGVFVDNELHWPRKNVGPVAETYYKVVKQVLKELAPNVLYLGSRIHGSGEPRPAYRAAAKHCDVVSINRYQFAIVDEDLPNYCRVALLAFMIGSCSTLLAQSDTESLSITVNVQTYNQAGHLGSPYRYQVRKVSDKPDGTKLPTVIFCHGSGGGVKDFPPAEKEIQWQQALSQNGDSYYFFTPKSGKKSGSLSAEGLQQFIANVVTNYDVDPQQITIIGYSAGSRSVTSTAVNKGDLIKSAIVIEGGFRGSVPADHTLEGGN